MSTLATSTDLCEDKKSHILFRIAVLTVLYFILGRIGLMISVPPGYATILWPPSGLALAAVLICGCRVWPGIFIGSFLLNLYTLNTSFWDDGNSFQFSPVPLLIAGGSTLQAVVARFAIKKTFGDPLNFKVWNDIALLAFWVIPLTCVVAATIGVGSLTLFSILPKGTELGNWVTWWMGDVLGIIFVAPLILLSSKFNRSVHWQGLPVVGISFVGIIVLLLTMFLTFYSWIISVKTNYEKNNLLFQNQVIEVEQALLNRMNSYELGLKAGAGLFASSDFVSFQDWKTYVSQLDLETSYPGINGVGWIKSFPASQKEEYLAWTQKNMYEGYNIHPDKNINQDVYYVITYIEPIEKNKPASGLDIAFEKNRFDAANLARDTGDTALTKKIVLVQDEKKTPGFLILYPMYQKGAKLQTVDQRRSALIGWIYAPLIASRFMDHLSSYQGKYFHMRVYDGDLEEEEALVYDTNKFRHLIKPPEYSIKHTVDIEQARWTIVWDSTPLFEEQANDRKPDFILLGGMAFSFILLAFLYSLAQRTRIVEALVEEKTEELRVQKQELQFIFDHVPVRIWYKDDKNNILKLNMQAAQSMGGDVENFEGKNTKEFYPDMADMFLEDDQRVLSTGVPMVGKLEPNNPVDGKFSWLCVDKAPFVDPVTGKRTLLVVARDVTEQKLAEDRLKLSDERYDLAVRGLSVGLWDWDFATDKVFRSELMYKIMGIKEGDASDTSSGFFDRIHPDDTHIFEQSIEDHLSSGKPHDVEFRLRHEDGHYIWCRSSGQATWDEEGNPIRMVGSLEDITSRKYAEEALVRSEELNNLAVRGMSVGLWDWNIGTGDITTSYKIHELLDWHATGDNIATFDQFIQSIHPDDVERVSIAVNTHFVHRTPYDIEFRLKTSGDKYIWVNACGQAKWDETGKPIRMVGSIANIDRRKRAEEDLIRSNAELERFAYVASHDLQEPLRMIRNFTQLLREEYADKFDDQARQYMDYVVNGASRMQNMVADLLEYSRLSKEIDDAQSVDCNLVIRNVIENLKQSLEESSGRVSFRDLPVIQGNAARITSLLQNLIGNAIKYRHKDVSPEIIIDVDDQDEYWLFSVMDNGIGIKEEYLDQIFVLFKRLHRNSEYQGTGIGLAICKKIVESMGGQIWAESVYGQGSAFYFTVPKKSVVKEVAQDE